MSANSSMFAPNTLANTAAGLGCAIGGLGLTAWVTPQTVLQLFGFPNAISLGDRELVSGLTQFFGVRNIALGISVLAVRYYGCRSGDSDGYKALGAIMLAGSMVTISDGIVSKKVTGGGHWKHWSLTPVMAGLGAGLIGWI